MKMSSVVIHSVAACCRNGGIGVNGDLAWRLPKEFRHFSKLTTGTPPEGKNNVVVMGRKTWESIPEKFRPLKNRINFVLTKNEDITKLDGADAVVHSVQELVNTLQSDQWKDKVHQIFNVGGSQIYKLIQDSPYCGNIFLTRVMADYKCDTFFPDLNEFEQLKLDEFQHIPQTTVEEKGIKWKVEVYGKRSSKQDQLEL